jgi:hypothetical protein
MLTSLYSYLETSINQQEKDLHKLFSTNILELKYFLSLRHFIQSSMFLTFVLAFVSISQCCFMCLDSSFVLVNVRTYDPKHFKLEVISCS